MFFYQSVKFEEIMVKIHKWLINQSVLRWKMITDDGPAAICIFICDIYNGPFKESFLGQPLAVPRKGKVTSMFSS